MVTSPQTDSLLLMMRPWRDIARELAQERNRNRVAELGEELNRALEEQEPNGLPLRANNLSSSSPNPAFEDSARV